VYATSTANANGILGAFGTVITNDWLAKNGAGNLLAYNTNTDTSLWAAGDNVSVALTPVTPLAGRASDARCRIVRCGGCVSGIGHYVQAGGAVNVGRLSAVGRFATGSGSALLAAGTSTLFDTSIAISGSPGTDVPGSIINPDFVSYNATLSLSGDGHDVILTVAVPEPGCTAILLCGLAMLAGRRGRKMI
jgi:hypothetical protein